MYQRTYSSKVLAKETQPEVRTPFPWRRVLWWTFGCVVAGAIVWLLKFPSAQVQTVSVSGTSVADPQEVQSVIFARLNGHYLWVLPRTSIFLVPTDRLAKHVQQAFPRFKNVSVEREGLTSLVVTVQEYKGAYIWCPEGVTLSVESTCSFMSGDGVVFAPAPYFSGDAYQKIFSGIPSRREYPFIPLREDDRALANTLDERLRAINIVPLEFHFVDVHKIIVVFMHNDHLTELLIDPTKDVESYLEVLYSGLRTEPVATMYRDEAKVLEYLDLRFDTKLVYKFQE